MQDEAERQAYAVNLLDMVITDAYHEFGVPFIGMADPATYATIMNAVAGSDRSCLLRLQGAGEMEELGVPYLTEATDGEDTVSAVVIWVCPEGEEEEELRLMVADSFNEMSFQRADAETFSALVTGTKQALLSLIDWTQESFIAVRMVGTSLSDVLEADDTEST